VAVKEAYSRASRTRCGPDFQPRVRKTAAAPRKMAA